MISKNYTTIEELLLDESFWQFYFQKDEDAVLDWQDWYEDDCERTALVNQAREMLDRLSLKWSETQIKERLQQLNYRIDPMDWAAPQTDLAKPEMPTILWQKSAYWWAAAASIALIISGLWLFSDKKSGDTEGWQNVVNTTQKTLSITLPDQSLINLEPQSTLRYPTHFATDKREVYLSGNAFFDVARKPDQPFYVYSGDVVTQVLGTSFWIKHDDLSKKTAENIVVEVVSGRVSVYKKKEGEKAENTEGVFLTPNLKATYIADNQLFVTGLVEKPILLQPEKKINTKPDQLTSNFIFNDAALSDVLDILEKSYGIQIELARESMLTCTLTADLNAATLFEKLDLICGSFNAQYNVQGTTILITGQGCPDDN